MSHLIDVADLMADEELIIHDNTAEYERQLADLSERLDALLLAAPWLNYHGIGTGDAWPASRHKEVFRAAKWLSGFKRLDAKPRASSYILKHIVERATGRYISNGSMIAAAVLSGVEITPVKGSINALIGIPAQSYFAANAIAERRAEFRDLVGIEPELKGIADDAKAYKRASRGQPHVCANERWYGYFEWQGKGLKARFRRLVGWESSNPILRNSHAYDVGYRALFALLPNCRNCGCHFREWPPQGTDRRRTQSLRGGGGADLSKALFLVK